MCGKSFLAKNYNQKYCCEDHQREAVNARKRQSAYTREFQRSRCWFNWVVEYDPEPIAPFHKGAEFSATEVKENLERMAFNFGLRLYNKKNKNSYVVVPFQSQSKLEKII